MSATTGRLVLPLALAAGLASCHRCEPVGDHATSGEAVRLVVDPSLTRPRHSSLCDGGTHLEGAQISVNVERSAQRVRIFASNANDFEPGAWITLEGDGSVSADVQYVSDWSPAARGTVVVDSADPERVTQCRFEVRDERKRIAGSLLLPR